MLKIRSVIALMTLLIAAAIAVQDRATAQDSACSDPLLVAFGEDTKFESACEAFMACKAFVEEFTPCTPHFYAERAADCAGDQNCMTQALLHTALIGLTVGNGYVDHGQPNNFWSDLAEKIADIETLEVGKFDELMLWYAPLAKSYISHPMLEYSYGVLAELDANADSAADYFDRAVTEDSANPIIYLARGDFHAAQANNDLAALDYFMTSAITGAPGLHEGLETLLTGRTSAYPFDYSAAKAYALYPVLLTHEGPGGRAIADLTLEPLVEVYLQQHNERLLFIPSDVEADREANQYRVLLPFYAMSETTAGDVYWSGTEYATGYASRLRMIGTDLIYAGTRTDIVFEGLTTHQFILVPEGSDDPRPDEFRCEGAPVTRLEGAVFATPLRYWERVQLYDEPGGTAMEIEQDSQMLIAVRGGPECLGGYTWWQVAVTIESEEQTGWIQENVDGNQYSYDRIDYD